MQKDTKQIIIYGAFGLLLGAKIVEVLFTGSASILDWWLLLLGVAAAIFHYIPTKADASSTTTKQGWSTEDSAEDRLVLRDYSHPQRSQATSAHPERTQDQLVR